MKTLDEGLAEAISSIIWVTPRLQADVQELKVVSEELAAKVGSQTFNIDWAQACFISWLESTPKMNTMGFIGYGEGNGPQGYFPLNNQHLLTVVGLNSSLFDKVKSYVPGPNVIKLFLSVTYEFS